MKKATRSTGRFLNRVAFFCLFFGFLKYFKDDFRTIDQNKYIDLFCLLIKLKI